MPFTLQPAIGGNFIDRQELLAEMFKTLTDPGCHAGFALYGKRRVGKTSIFLELKKRLANHPFAVPVYFSMWELVENTADELAGELTAAILTAYKNKLRLKQKIKSALKLPLRAIREFLNAFRLSFRLQNDIELLLTLKEQKQKRTAAKVIDKLFSLPENLAKETKTRCVLFIDEFPALMDLKNGQRLGQGIIQKIRTILETKQNIVLCVSGSIRKTMELAALSPSSAFYRQFIAKEIKPFDQNIVARLLTNNLAKPLSSAALKSICNFSCGIPFYVQFLGLELQKHAGSRVEEKDVKKIINTFLAEEGNLLFFEEFRRLSPKEKKLLLVMAGESVTSSSLLSKAAGEKPSIVSRYLKYLEDKGVVRKESRGVYQFEDPVFKMWLKIKSAVI